VDSRTVIRTYLVVHGLFTLSASLIWGVNTLFLLDAGLNIFEVFVANAVFTAAMALFEIPTGVLADTRGRRISFLASESVLLVGTLAYVGVAAIGGGVVLFSLASIVLGLGYTFYSGAVEAWLVDALKAVGHQGELDPVFARASMVSGAAMVIGTVGGGLLGTLDLAWPYLVRSALLAAAFAVGFATMHDIGFTPRTLRWSKVVSEMGKVGRAGITYGLRTPSVRLLMTVTFLHFGFFSWAWYAWQPYFLELLGRDAVWVAGVIAALFALAGILGNSLVPRFCRPGTRRTTVLISASAILAATMTGVGLVQVFWVAVPLFLIGAVAMGVFGPVEQTFLHSVIPSEQRATLVSFDSLVGSVGSIGGQTGLGYLSQVRSIPAGFVVGGLTTFLALPVLRLLRRLAEPADHVTGATHAATPADEPVDRPGAGGMTPAGDVTHS
jgi:MFS family permease